MTRRVRIAVVVDPDGAWGAAGAAGATDEQALAWAIDSRDTDTPPGQVVWVEAEVPVPAPVTVEGEAA